MRIVAFVGISVGVCPLFAVQILPKLGSVPFPRCTFQILLKSVSVPFFLRCSRELRGRWVPNVSKGSFVFPAEDNVTRPRFGVRMARLRRAVGRGTPEGSGIFWAGGCGWWGAGGAGRLLRVSSDARCRIFERRGLLPLRLLLLDSSVERWFQALREISSRLLRSGRPQSRMHLRSLLRGDGNR